jgi:hypothetical protein
MARFAFSPMVIIARDIARNIRLKSFVTAFGEDHARRAFEESFPSSRFEIEEIREALGPELAESLSDGTFIQELLDWSGDGVLAYTTDIP